MNLHSNKVTSHGKVARSLNASWSFANRCSPDSTFAVTNCTCFARRRTSLRLLAPRELYFQNFGFFQDEFPCARFALMLLHSVVCTAAKSDWSNNALLALWDLE